MARQPMTSQRTIGMTPKIMAKVVKPWNCILEKGGSLAAAVKSTLRTQAVRARPCSPLLRPVNRSHERHRPLIRQHAGFPHPLSRALRDESEDMHASDRIIVLGAS